MENTAKEPGDAECVIVDVARAPKARGTETDLADFKPLSIRLCPKRTAGRTRRLKRQAQTSDSGNSERK